MRRMRLLAIAAALLVPAVAFSAAATLTFSKFRSQVGKVAIAFPEQDAKVKGLCVCLDPPDHNNQAGRLLSFPETVGNTTRLSLRCQFIDFDATTGALQFGAACTAWLPLTK